MQIIRDDEYGGIMMIPLFQQYGITKCNIRDCKDESTTLCLHEQANFGLCEKHYQEGKEAGTMKLQLEFNNGKYRCDMCKDSGAVTVGEGEYATCPCVGDERN